MYTILRGSMYSLCTMYTHTCTYACIQYICTYMHTTNLRTYNLNINFEKQLDMFIGWNYWIDWWCVYVLTYAYMPLECWPMTKINYLVTKCYVHVFFCIPVFSGTVLFYIMHTNYVIHYNLTHENILAMISNVLCWCSICTNNQKT